MATRCGLNEVATRGRISIRTRLTLIVAVASIVAVVGGGAVLFRVVSSSNVTALADELRVHAHDVAGEVNRGVVPSLSSGIETQVLSTVGKTVQPAGEVPLLDPEELAAAQRADTFFDRRISNTEQLVFATRVTAPNGDGRVVVTAASTSSITRSQRQLVLALGSASFLMIVATTSAAWLVSGAALRPVRAMTRRAQTLSTEDPEARLPLPPGRDELAELGATLNQLLGRLADARSRERSFVDDASHELRAPLAVMCGELELALLEHREGIDSQSTEEALVSALQEADRLASLTNHLLTLARADAGMLDQHRVRISLHASVDAFIERLDVHRTRVDLEGTAGYVCASAMAIDQIVTNLIVNATRWATSRVLCQIEDRSGQVLLRVCDDGPGFDETYLAHAFERFRRGDPARGRTRGGGGLGLAIAAAIVTAQGGAITIGNGSTLEGAWVEVTLPAAPVADDG